MPPWYKIKGLFEIINNRRKILKILKWNASVYSVYSVC